MKHRFLFYTVFSFVGISVYGQDSWQMKPVNIHTRWAKLVSPGNALSEYPRPQMIRKNWTNLNGLWDYAIMPKGAQAPVEYDGKILVPFPLESALSGVQKPLKPNQELWYRRTIQYRPLAKMRTILNFGAVDNEATVFINGSEVTRHKGGFTSFSADISRFLKDGENELIVKVFDPTEQGVAPHGKQVLNPQNIYYTASSGIWQTVWLESVPEVSIGSLKITPDIDAGSVDLQVVMAGAAAGGYLIRAKITNAAQKSSFQGEIAEGLKIRIPHAHLWSPEAPFLYRMSVYLLYDGRTIDSVSTYFGMRKIEVKKDAAGTDRIFLNNRYTYNLGTLDQGFWPDGLLTAPTDEALAFDIKAIKAMGFNTIRKHIKVEPDRWYYHCDRLGVLVWQDFVNPPYQLPEGAKEEFEKEAAATIGQLQNHPCITTWVLFNEKWGAYDQQRLTEWVKKMDPARLINGHSGEMLYVNEQLRSPSPNAWVSADMTDVHSYPDPMNAPAEPGKARILGEFGGIGVFIPDHQWNTGSAWGYVQVTIPQLKSKYTIMNQHLKLLEREGLSGSIYTQPFDVEGEQNGLMTYDREIVKIPFAELRQIHHTLVAGTGKTPEVTAKNADDTEPGIIYSRLLQDYINGKKDPVFLRKLSMLARQAGDKAGASRISNDYVKSLSAPLSSEDLEYVLQNTSKVSDPGFVILEKQAIDTSYPEHRRITLKLMNTIFMDLMEPLVRDTGAIVDWSDLEQKIRPFGAAGEEIYLRAKTIFYYNKQDWRHYEPVAKVYLQKYGRNMSEQERRMFENALNKNS